MELQKNEKKQTIRWKAGKEIGFGSFGRVIEGLNKLTEVKLLSEMKHKNIVKYIDVQEDKNGQHISVLLEYLVGGSICDQINKYGKLNENIVKKYTKDILQGLEYLHYHGIVHRDIKGANILVDHNGVCKVADFGEAKKIIQQEKQLSLQGTANWMAPEVIKQQNYGRFSDIWSLGGTVIEMLSGKPPFSGLGNALSTMYKIAQDNKPPEIPHFVSDECKDFLDKCFKINPLERWNIYQLLRHQFITDQGTSYLRDKQKKNISDGNRMNSINKLKEQLGLQDEKQEIQKQEIQEQEEEFKANISDNFVLSEDDKSIKNIQKTSNGPKKENLNNVFLDEEEVDQQNKKYDKQRNNYI
ncbi:protein kinase domain protein [Ichthyophthirius multifiliis]|uniref:Protein kinase domain protein n=1 Tax=Ichthyophthirius multifiliis TaxID=5932 RepID=G0QSR7_ICHMU|nr:protein kinase domain protein [Ichthyophthirius multifiliis]EGR31736.1 protein kinase domain protein [Ichthyophthirius multifiliis]|eukprot:XP_004035222.1 protein kinase domain protein [Ichthyophthirius multifiliis]